MKITVETTRSHVMPLPTRPHRWRSKACRAGWSART